MRLLTFFFGKLRKLIVPPTPYTNLSLLIKRCIKRMKITPLCQFCDLPMMFRYSTISWPPLRDDQVWKCIKCFHTVHFGIPLTKKEYVREFALRGGRHLIRPSYRSDERNKKEVLERLRALGYMAF